MEGESKFGISSEHLASYTCENLAMTARDLSWIVNGDEAPVADTRPEAYQNRHRIGQLVCEIRAKMRLTTGFLSAPIAKIYTIRSNMELSIKHKISSNGDRNLTDLRPIRASSSLSSAITGFLAS
jgi:hypothetical protein